MAGSIEIVKELSPEESKEIRDAEDHEWKSFMEGSESDIEGV